jgi:hypothetical protein
MVKHALQRTAPGGSGFRAFHACLRLVHALSFGRSAKGTKWKRCFYVLRVFPWFL